MQVRTLVQQEMRSALEQYNLLVSPVAPTTAYRLGEVRDDPLQMYKGDIMTVNLNLAGTHVPFPNAPDSAPAIPVPFGSARAVLLLLAVHVPSQLLCFCFLLKSLHAARAHNP